MITRLKIIKGLGIFSNFRWEENVSDFARYNLIYGWNGCGKTTLSALFAGLNDGAVAGHEDAQYEIGLGAATSIRNGDAFPVKVRVFNRDYVEKNVHTLSGRARPIMILGEENKKIIDEIEADEATLAIKNQRRQKLIDQFKDAKKRREKLFTDIARTIGQNTAGLATRAYRRPDAEEAFAKLEGKTTLDDTALAASLTELRQAEQPDVLELQVPSVADDRKPMTIVAFLDQAKADAKRLCALTVESKLVERLKSNPDIGTWVESGLALHEAHQSKMCEFCDRVLPEQRMEVLAGHFNAADRQLKLELQDLLERLGRAKVAVRQIRAPEKANLYDELRGEYQKATLAIEETTASLIVAIDGMRASLEKKKAHTTEPLALKDDVDASRLVKAIEDVNWHIGRHNTKTAGFKAAKEDARKRLEIHYLCTVYDDVEEADKTIAAVTEAGRRVTEGDPVTGEPSLQQLRERIEANRARISSPHKGCEAINTALRTFLGRNELQFEVEDDGYVLKRRGEVAKGLSEGERTAIGLVYFTVHLKDEGFDPSEGIIVVDDPISSLDSNSIYQAFAFLKNAVQDAKQVFILTHDFDFLKLVIDWMKRVHHAFYMINNDNDTEGARVASIGRLDKLLEEHESEYHYLFKRLYTFRSDGTIETAYQMPNMARKVLDSFLMFRVPRGGTPYSKLEELKEVFDENKLIAIYKFTNDQSHITGKGFDPSLVPETQKNVTYLLEMIETVFPEHYKILVASMA